MPSRSIGAPPGRLGAPGERCAPSAAAAPSMAKAGAVSAASSQNQSIEAWAPTGRTRQHPAARRACRWSASGPGRADEGESERTASKIRPSPVGKHPERKRMGNRVLPARAAWVVLPLEVLHSYASNRFARKRSHATTQKS